MKKEQQPMEAYEAPKVKVVEVEVERGFAVSMDDYRYGGDYSE